MDIGAAEIRMVRTEQPGVSSCRLQMMREVDAKFFGFRGVTGNLFVPEACLCEQAFCFFVPSAIGRHDTTTKTCQRLKLEKKTQKSPFVQLTAAS